MNGYTKENIEAMLSIYLRCINHALTYSYENKVALKSMGGVVSDRFKSIKDKKLLIRQKELYIDEEVIKSVGYTNYEIVDDARYREAIMNKEDVLIFMHVPSVKFCYYYVISSKTGELYYLNVGMVGEKYYKTAQKKMFKKFAK